MGSMDGMRRGKEMEILPWSDDRMGWKEIDQEIGEKRSDSDWDAKERSMAEPLPRVPLRVIVSGVLRRVS